MIFRVVVCLGLALISTILAQDALGDSGLKIDTIQAPPADCPRKAKKHDMLVLHYQGFFENGTKFDSRYVALLKLIQLFKILIAAIEEKLNKDALLQLPERLISFCIYDHALWGV